MEETPYLAKLIEREFNQEKDIEKALAIVAESKGIQRSQELAKYYALLAIEQLDCLKPSPFSQSLTELVNYVLDRLY